MSKCLRCWELLRSAIRSVLAIKFSKDSGYKKPFTPETFDSPTVQFEQDGIDSSAAPQPGAASLDFWLSYIDNMDDPENSPPAHTIESIDTGLTYPTNLELQTELSWFHQTEEPYHDASHFTPQPLNGDLPLLHEQRTAMYGTDETLSALWPPPEPNNEFVTLSHCNTSRNPAMMLQTSTFNWTDQSAVPPNYPDLTSFSYQTTDPLYECLVECEEVAEGDEWYIPLPPTPARRLGWWAIINMVRAWIISLSRIRSRMGLKRKCKEDNDYVGVRHKKSRLGKYVVECRLSTFVHGKKAEKVWLGSFSTPKDAARAYDVGRMFCSKRAKGFNFRESEDILSVLKHVILNLPLPARKKAIQDVASEYGKTGCIDGCTLKYCSQDNKPIRWNSEVGR